MEQTTDGLRSWSTVLDASHAWRPEAERVLVVAPHPDDEALMFGGLITYAISSGMEVDLIAVTDGDGAYPELGGEMLAELRRREQAESVEMLGLDPAKITRLGVRDGAVAEHEDEVADAIAEHLRRHRVDLLVAPWEHDHHPDHEACGRAARRAAGHRPVVLASGLFWSLLRERPPHGLRVHALDLTDGELRRKQRAIDRHASQVTSLVVEQPMLGDPELAPTRWRREHYLVGTP